MAKVINLTPGIDYGAKRLNRVARKIVSLAFRMGGTPVDYYRAVKCNYQFPDGHYCWDEVRQTPDINCPVCGGRGAYYIGPIKIPAIFIDNRNKIIRDKTGVKFNDDARLVVPPSIVPSILKHIDGGKNLQVLRDKFVIRNHLGEIDSIFYVDSEPKDTWLAGTLYYSFSIVVSRVNETNDTELYKEYEPTLFYNNPGEGDTEEILKQINEEILSLHKTVSVQNEDGYAGTESLVLDAETGQFITVSDLDEDWV